jgi:methyl-accepting chemotaxis protein
MKWNVGTKIGAGFALALAMLIGTGSVSYQSTNRLTEAAGWVAHTHQVLEQLGQIIQALDDAETGQRGYIITGDELYLEPYRTGLSILDQRLSSLRSLTSDNGSQQRRLDRLVPLMAERLAVLKTGVELRAAKEQGFERARAWVATGTGKRAMDEIRKIIGEMDSEERALLLTRSDEAQATARNTTRTIAAVTLAAVILLTVAAVVITRNIAGPLRDLTTVAERITLGDLRVNVSTNARRDEVGVLARTFDRMTQSLRGMAGAAEQIAAGDLRSTVTPQSSSDVLGNAFARMAANLREQTRQLVEGANVLGAAASAIVASTAQLASTASESAAAVSETTTTVEEVRQTAQVASEKAQQVFDSAQKAAQISQGGRKSTEDVGAGMTRIRQQMDAIAASMGRLSEQSQTIGQIIATVEDLSVQSNLLAVNAAIEAAKAGEHGKGFAVVAQEVKSLAAQSRQATSEVRTILSDIQKATTTAVLATEQGTKAVEAGTRQTEVAGQSIQSLAGSVTEAAQAATQIAASSQQQLIGVDQVAAAMASIKQASAQNVAGAKQLETAARNINDLGQQLKQMVAHYQV